MAHIYRPVQFVSGTVFDAADLNSNFTDIYSAFNGNIDDSNIKSGANIDAAKLLNSSITSAKIANNTIGDGLVDYTSVKVVRTGPNSSAGPNGTRIAKGLKTSAYSSGVVSFTVTFSTDSDDGDPQFLNAPRITCTPQHTLGGTDIHTVKVTEERASGFTVEMRHSGVATNDAISLQWIAVGPV